MVHCRKVSLELKEPTHRGGHNKATARAREIKPAVMPRNGRSVASYYNRSVYKTEFDIFKQNTELDLISLASLEDDPKELEFLKRRCTSSRDPDRRPAGQDYSRNRAVNRCVSARYPVKTELGLCSRKNVSRNCKSALGAHRDKVNNDCATRPRCKTTCGVRRTGAFDLGWLNKRPRISVDSRQAGHVTSVGVPRARTAVHRHPQPAPTTRPKTASSAPAPVPSQGETRRTERHTVPRKRLKSAGSSVRARSARTKARTRVEFVDSKNEDNTDTLVPQVNPEQEDVGDTEKFVSEEKISETQDDNNKHVNNDRDVSKQDETIERSVNFKVNGIYDNCCQSPSNVQANEVDATCKEEDDVIESASVFSGHGSSNSEDSADVTNGTRCPDEIHVDDYQFDLNDLIRTLVSQDAIENPGLKKPAEDPSCASDKDSLFSVSSEEDTGAQISEEPVTDLKDTSPIQDLRDIIMSREAKSVIIETLYDLRGSALKDNKENHDDNIRFKSVAKQKRIKENRNKYDHFMRERTNTMIQLNIKPRDDSGSERGDHADDSYESDFEESTHEDVRKPTTKLFPSIRESHRQNNNCSSNNYNNNSNNNSSSHTGSSVTSKHVFSLDQVKTRKYKIPGIGNYDLVASPDNDFEITPPGFDCRYDVRPILTKEELDPPPKFIRERSIQKCRKWLKNVNLSPLSLNPAVNKR